ncbi:protein-methionine-sulfoxide reductase catalytic subunit MsrP [Marinomonas balearica]|uniref:Protein-methionine-sulfoxide reductase catalytic subunit MsrP n=1 Tax=Marinomonas balearica TaxID=491947 RepID=A0A4R6M9Z1_9GAMM|nr:protein-methionine-sulfoxide reductase catalytic subunit MsrP [Marinomonas balearica]TDO98338.1 sulfoxide reductase catalytic subunit YedY [Marinomonas balearica]
MQIKIAKTSECHESTVTPKSIYLNRRQFMQAGIVGSAALSLPVNSIAATGENTNPLSPPASLKPSFGSISKTAFGSTETPAPFDTATTYNNFYEFGYGKGDPEKKAASLKPYPWKINIEGEADITGAFDLEDLIKESQLEERIYRLRCVEAWSMVVPWIGIPLGSFLKKFRPNSKAKYVYFETLYDPTQMPAQNGNALDWPYREGLRIDEAMNSLTLLSVGMYGSILPNQNGAPVRLVVPWKYGFKSIKSIVTIRFVEQMPQTTWNMIAPNEYGFYANVNPGVDHPRWSQKKERRLPGGLLFPNVIDTQMFNGYQEEVASLYADMDITRFY